MITAFVGDKKSFGLSQILQIGLLLSFCTDSRGFTFSNLSRSYLLLNI